MIFFSGYNIQWNYLKSYVITVWWFEANYRISSTLCFFCALTAPGALQPRGPFIESWKLKLMVSWKLKLMTVESDLKVETVPCKNDTFFYFFNPYICSSTIKKERKLKLMGAKLQIEANKLLLKYSNKLDYKHIILPI